MSHIARRRAEIAAYRIRDLYGDRLSQIVLFGPVARAEDVDESDIDLIAVLTGPVDAPRERDRLDGLLWELLLEFGQVVSVIPISEDDFRKQTPLTLNVRHEGIAI